MIFFYAVATLVLTGTVVNKYKVEEDTTFLQCSLINIPYNEKEKYKAEKADQPQEIARVQINDAEKAGKGENKSVDFRPESQVGRM